ncbi:hypothetical protein ACHAWO_000136 [Cyclotella atomus]|uniref:Uncharacterized protein n=1 Tax=Cyclotella atomus TaxID=382360 RepID=A0ABD3PTB2_9STRA
MDQADPQNEATDLDDPQQQADEITANPNVRVPNKRLAQICANFTIQGIRGNSRASSTFAAHQRNNERLILFLYDGLLRAEISSFLGPPGSTPPRQTVIFDAFTASADTFAQFLTTVKSNDNGIKKGQQTYASYQSSMTFLFRRYRYSPLQAFDEDVRDDIDRVTRSSAQAMQAGEGNHEGTFGMETDH